MISFEGFGLEFIPLFLFSPAIIGFILGFFKRTNWISVLLISLLTEIFLVLLKLYIYDYNPKYDTFVDLIKNSYDFYLEFTLPYIPFSLVTWLIVRGIKRWIENNEKNRLN